MVKRTTYTSITPLPPSISRETALEFIHDHSGMIELNPLVIRHEITSPPPNATPEEAKSCIWYSITDKMSYIPGLIESELTYKGGFYDLPNGIQTHVFAPAGVDIRAYWRVGGNMPGEERETAELGVDKPRDGLYLREDVDLRCSVLLAGFVKRNLKKSHAVLVDTLVAKALESEKTKAQKSQLDSESGVESVRLGSAKDATSHQGNLSKISNAARKPSSGPKTTTSQACGCSGTMHGAGCSLYYNGAYGPLSLPQYNEELTPIVRNQLSGPPASSEAASPADDSPITQHPCYCQSGGVHIATCEFYPNLVRPPTQKFPRPYSLSDTESQIPGLNGSHAQEQVSRSNLTRDNEALSPPGDDWHDAQMRPEALRSRSAAMELDGFPIASLQSGARAVELE
ncbi:Hypothetical protein R9X50_00430200 [Acrodontium crateriforme]|uniref:DUF7053 domain-containing protein n=1 Tax=Acrodontium crateriforme TaxID=150365 RepID=A0AAQ3RA34_9PEZI|nr:Hypothetical protein R9X50_00430200 [Acrodontium crateriforme]